MDMCRLTMFPVQKKCTIDWELGNFHKDNAHKKVQCVKFLRFRLIRKFFSSMVAGYSGQVPEAFLAFSLLPGIGKAR